MAQLQLTKEQKLQEFVACYQDITYFSKKYCYIQEPKKGRIRFNLFPFQEKTIKELGENRKVIILKSRQMGISTLMAMKALWMMIFMSDQNIVVIATKQEVAKEIVNKVTLMWELLPAYIKGSRPPVNKNKTELKLANGSRIKCFSASDNSGRSQAASLLIIDEAAFVPGIDELYKSVSPSLSTGGSCVILSTPAGAFGFFYEHWNKAKSGENGFFPIELPWKLHPDRDDKWFAEQVADLGVKGAAQEFDCNFQASGDTVIPGELLEQWEKDNAVDPLYRRNPNGKYKDDAYWVFEAPYPGTPYLVIVDTARGTGKDESTVHVMDLLRWVQVAEYAGQMPPEELAPFAAAVGYEYNTALIIAENTGMGHSTCMLLGMHPISYPNLYQAVPGTSTMRFDQYMQKDAIATDEAKVIGFSMNSATRPMAIQTFVAKLENHPKMIKSKRTYRQLKSFIWVNGKEQAAQGTHDDLIVMLAAGCLLQNTALDYSRRLGELTKLTMEHFTVMRPYDNLRKQGIDPYNPYSINHQGTHIPAIPGGIPGFDNSDLNFNWLLK